MLVKPNVREIYDFKIVISALRISTCWIIAKIVLKEFAKELKLMKVVAISR